MIACFIAQSYRIGSLNKNKTKFFLMALLKEKRKRIEKKPVNTLESTAAYRIQSIETLAQKGT